MSTSISAAARRPLRQGETACTGRATVSAARSAATGRTAPAPSARERDVPRLPEHKGHHVALALAASAAALCSSATALFGFAGAATAAAAGAACLAATAAARLGLSHARAQRNAIRDVALMLAAEQESAQLAATLAQTQVSELGSEVERLRATEADLVTAKREAEDAAMAKGEFLATMSHEIRTPLNGILPILELVLSRPLESEVRHQVAAAFESAREMRRIVNDVLDFSKLEAGALQLEVVSMRPAEIVNSVCTLMKRSADGKQLRLACDVDASVPPVVRGDALRFRQVLTNLVGNAIKFTARGEVMVSARQIGEDRTHRIVRIEVADTGAGIAPEAAERLFQPFSQADASTARAHGGTGLGLAICRRIVDSMGGRIGVDSALGRGSTFWFEIPLLRVAGEAVSAALASVHALLLTRDELVKDAWMTSLGALDIRTACLGTVYEALTHLRTALQHRSLLPQLLVLDLASASKTAVSLTRPLLSEEGFSQVRLLVLGESADGLGSADQMARIALAPRDLRDAAAHRVVRELLAERAPDQSAAAAEGPVIRVSREPSHRFDGLRVLLVDDIAINRYAGQATLEKLGARVTAAGGGREAIDQLRRGEFDLVLMDCQMPDVDGFSATRVRRLQEREQGLPRLPILAVTANAMPGDRERCLEAGMDDHLAKPIELGTLARMLGRWAKRHAVPPFDGDAASAAAEPASVESMPMRSGACMADLATAS
jgi:signal transduction histidine kinase/CheY-like chemotaxis protein